jgi:hypothetical protein
LRGGRGWDEVAGGAEEDSGTALVGTANVVTKTFRGSLVGLYENFKEPGRGDVGGAVVGGVALVEGGDSEKISTQETAD